MQFVQNPSQSVDFCEMSPVGLYTLIILLCYVVNCLQTSVFECLFLFDIKTISYALDFLKH